MFTRERLQLKEGAVNQMSDKKKTKDAPGMAGIRSRTEKGPLRQKRGDTRVSTIEKQYGRDFGVRGDMHLSTLLKRRGVESLNDLLHGKK
jgi:hypothetical protein